jgi:hypothetical protein
MKIKNVKVYDLEESILASGYPMQTEVQTHELNEKDLRRANKLSGLATTDNPAHGQFLTGIRVAFDLTFSNKAWVEAERYRFLEFVSSQSTMHRITRFNLRDQYNEYVNPHVVDIMVEMVAEYNAMSDSDPDAKAQKYLEILYTNPAGFELTARLTTDYRCLKNIYKQRRDHRLPEWREFCKWVETLPYAEELLLN